MRAQGLKTQGYKTGGTLRRVLMCAVLCAAVWVAFALFTRQLGMPPAFSLRPQSTQPPQENQPEEKTYLTEEITLPGHTWYALQLGAFTQENAAQQLSQEFVSRGAAGYVCREENVYRVYAAAYPTRAEAQSVQTRLSDQGVTTYIQALDEPELLLRAQGTEEQVRAVRECLTYLNALSGKFYSLSCALDTHEMDARSALEALLSEGVTCREMALALQRVFAQEEAPQVAPLQMLLQQVADTGESLQNNTSAARIGAALKKCQLTVTAEMKSFAAFLSAQP